MMMLAYDVLTLLQPTAEPGGIPSDGGPGYAAARDWIHLAWFGILLLAVVVFAATLLTTSKRRMPPRRMV